MTIIIHNRIAEIIHKYNSHVWRLRFLDNGEIINVFYSLSEQWEYYPMERLSKQVNLIDISRGVWSPPQTGSVTPPGCKNRNLKQDLNTGNNFITFEISIRLRMEDIPSPLPSPLIYK